eukprot:TRINITY_DN32836_c0_g1_i1.p1 TRINITY_DN32836_c0_g1~~TRINITY_DN32836_c0_g1_i1.p1  ORF type:complete len:352 (-),score=120.15 TRINITY_DN32836_c0_g1_i1:203-1258(-)
MALLLARRRSVAKLLWLGIAVVVTAAIAQLPASFLHGFRSSHLLRPSTFARYPTVQRNFFQFPDYEAEERERQRKLKEKQQAEEAAKRRDLLTKAGGAALGLVGVYIVATKPEDTSKATAGKTLAAPAGKQPSVAAPTAGAEASKAKAVVAKVEIDPKNAKRVQAAQLAAKKAQDAREKAAEETKKRQARKKAEDEQEAKRKAEAARQREAAKKSKVDELRKKKEDLEKSKKETDERIKQAKEEAAKTNPGGPQWGTILPLTAIAGAGAYFVGPKLKKTEPVKKAETVPAEAATGQSEPKAAEPVAEEKAAPKITEPAAEVPPVPEVTEPPVEKDDKATPKAAEPTVEKAP